MSTLEIVLLLHIAAAIVFFAGLLLTVATNTAAVRRSDPAEISVLLSLARIGALITAAGGIAVLAFGLSLVELTGREPSETWLSASVALLIAAFALGALGGRNQRRARKLAAQAHGETAPPAEEIIKLLRNPLTRAANTLATLASVAILVLMVWRPGG